MKKKLLFWAVALLIIVFCAAFMTSCSDSESTQDVHSAMLGKPVITDIGEYGDSKDSVYYHFEQDMGDYTYTGSFIAGRNEFDLHDVITFVLATDQKKTEDSIYVETQE